MGFDITFHPISKDELKEFVFDIIENPNLSSERASRITKNIEKQKAIKDIYSAFANCKEDVISGKASFSSTFAYGAAAIAGFLHPYWYARGACMSSLCEKEKDFCDFLESIYQLSPSTFKGMKDDGKGRISENYIGGGYIENSKLNDLKNKLNDRKYKNVVNEILGDEGLKALQHAIHYSITKSTGILEASDIVVPISDECVSDFDNFKAEFMGTDNNYQNTREI